MKTILVLCTGNSARSILGEAILNQLGAGRIIAYSAGSKPKGAPHPGALRQLATKGIDPSAFRSKSWDEFAAQSAPAIDIAITAPYLSARLFAVIGVCPTLQTSPAAMQRSMQPLMKHGVCLSYVCGLYWRFHSTRWNLLNCGLNWPQ
jgi:hypothetical protein